MQSEKSHFLPQKRRETGECDVIFPLKNMGWVTINPPPFTSPMQMHAHRHMHTHKGIGDYVSHQFNPPFSPLNGNMGHDLTVN